MLKKYTHFDFVFLAFPLLLLFWGFLLAKHKFSSDFFSSPNKNLPRLSLHPVQLGKIEIMYMKRATRVALKFCFVPGFFFNLEDYLQTSLLRSILNLCYIADLWERQCEIISTTLYCNQLLTYVK